MMRNTPQPLNLAQAVYTVALLAVFFLVSLATAQAATVTLGWNPSSSSSVTGYRVYYGATSGNYTATTPAAPNLISTTACVGTPVTCTYTTPDLPAGTYFAVKAFDGAGNESGFSNEVSSSGVVPPVASFTNSPNSGITTSTPITFTDTSSGTITSRSWTFGDGTTSTAASILKTYNTSGTYTASLTVGNTGGNNTASRTISVTAAAPVASFSATPTSGWAPLATSFTSTSTGTITSYAWIFGDGTTSTVQNPSHTYASAGTYTVSLTATGPGGSNTATSTSYISVTSATPVASFTASPTSGPAPLATTFTNTSTGNITGRSWNFGDGSTSTAQNPPAHTYTAAGSYTVRLTVTGPTGSNSTTRTVTAKSSSTGTLPSPWQSSDIGSVGLAGSAGYANGIYTLKGSGADIWGTADAFRFAYLPLNGNGTITARVASLINTDEWAKAGVMIRENLNADARYAMVAVTPAHGVDFQSRTTAGAASYYTAGAAVAAPYWVRLTRVGTTFTAYQSANGTSWVQVGSTTISIASTSTVYVGLALTSHNNSALSTATLDNVSVVTP